MNRKLFLFLLSLVFSQISFATPPSIKPFVSGSYQQILKDHQNHGLMMILWSLDCPTCIKDMELLSQIHKQKPGLKIVMIATDELSSSPEIEKLLEKYQLQDTENWVFNDDNAQKLRYEIDPDWYSELPRTYFFSPDHQREAFSGALKREEYLERFNKHQL